MNYGDRLTCLPDNYKCHFETDELMEIVKKEPVEKITPDSCSHKDKTQEIHGQVLCSSLVV